jgi:hypothetical protein
LCRAHNAYVAEHDYGKAAMARYRRSGNQISGAPAVYSAGRAVRPGTRAPCGR